MSAVLDTILKFKKKGCRLTRARKLLLSILEERSQPLSALELLNDIKKKGMSVNKTTVYRELEFLKAEGVIEEVNFGDRISRYEFTTYHHHHIVCTNCRRIEKIDSQELEQLLQELENKFKRVKSFLTLRHSLEFAGTCVKCVSYAS